MSAASDFADQVEQFLAGGETRLEDLLGGSCVHCHSCSGGNPGSMFYCCAEAV
jgi:hypothetical protein